MKTTHLYNTAHPLAESGKPIFIPFGEWKYDGTTRQRLDRAHGERIANELNARVSRGEPGIPVYAGHPDVPQLAAKYPDKGALGWVEKIELANEGGRDGLALTVAWDRDPGRGFRWFSPYWLANGREGSTYVVDSIASIGLVNNPNIPEFRLANEKDTARKTPYSLPPQIVELAAKRDRLANEANFDESKHPRALDGKFTSGGGGGGSGGSKTLHEESAAEIRRKVGMWKWVADRHPRGSDHRTAILKEINSGLTGFRSDVKTRHGLLDWVFGEGDDEKGAQVRRARGRAARREVHKAAILSGYTYNPKTHQYE